jgi:hypothetical protein
MLLLFAVGGLSTTSITTSIITTTLQLTRPAAKPSHLP